MSIKSLLKPLCDLSDLSLADYIVANPNDWNNARECTRDKNFFSLRDVLFLKRDKPYGNFQALRMSNNSLARNAKKNIRVCSPENAVFHKEEI